MAQRLRTTLRAGVVPGGKAAGQASNFSRLYLLYRLAPARADRLHARTAAANAQHNRSRLRALNPGDSATTTRRPTGCSLPQMQSPATLHAGRGQDVASKNALVDAGFSAPYTQA